MNLRQAVEKALVEARTYGDDQPPWNSAALADMAYDMMLGGPYWPESGDAQQRLWEDIDRYIRGRWGVVSDAEPIDLNKDWAVAPL